jgi:hypothetical protein
MSLIVDVNVLARVIVMRSDLDFGPVSGRLFTHAATAARLVHGGKLTEEYMKVSSAIRPLAALDRMGRVLVCPKAAYEQQLGFVESSGICASDDPHIIAIARAMAVRLLCSLDKDLHADFTNPALLSRPRGKVYQNATHEHLLDRFCKEVAAQRAGRKP